MSDAQFSSLSPNSSNDLSNRYNEENDLNDQETLSIVSNLDKNVANLDDFDDICDKIKTDPFLSDFMKEDGDDNGYLGEKSKNPQYFDNLSGQNFLESNDMNCFLYSMPLEDDLDNYIPVDEVAQDLLEWDDSSPMSSSSDQKPIINSNPNKRQFYYQENINSHLHEVPNKQRKMEISPQIRCNEWISKLNKDPTNASFKASGSLDRRKTKHHQILNDHDTDLYEENTGQQKEQKPFVDKNPTQNSLSSISVKLNSVKKSLSISIIPKREPENRSFTSNRNPNRKPFSTCNETSTDRHINSSSLPIPTNSLFANSSSSSRSNSDVIDISRIPEPLKMGKRISRRGQRFSLWQFLMCLLDSSRYKEHSTGIKWIHRNCGVFHIIDSKQVATLWGQYKERRDKMTYDSLARSLRHYYKKNLMAKINNRRLYYQIAQECLQWSSETFINRNRD